MPLSKRKVTSSDELSSGDESTQREAPNKKAKTLKTSKGLAGGEKHSAKQDDDGNAYWELTGRRRVTISEFKGTRMISVREYYEKDGKELPGKKGISLPLDQFGALVTLLPQIEEQLSGKGDKLPRPDYGGDAMMDDEEATVKKGRENYEETSDED